MIDIKKLHSGRYLGYVTFEELPKTVGDFEEKFKTLPLQWDFVAFSIDDDNNNGRGQDD